LRPSTVVVLTSGHLFVGIHTPALPTAERRASSPFNIKHVALLTDAWLHGTRGPKGSRKNW
jgi:hypothetical protein